MKKLLAIAILASALSVGAASAHCQSRTSSGECVNPHKASQFCKDHGKTSSEVRNDNLLVDSSSKTVGVCITPDGPAKGGVGAHQRSDGDAWVFVDGDDTNTGPTAGNLAVQVSQDTQKTGVSGACSGNYDHDRATMPAPGITSPATCAPAP